MVRDGEERFAAEEKHGGIFGKADGRRRGFGVSGGRGVHVLHGGDFSERFKVLGERMRQV